MNATRWLPAALLAVLAFQEAPEDRIDWVRDYDEGRRIARESGRPLIVVFR